LYTKVREKAHISYLTNIQRKFLKKFIEIASMQGVNEKTLHDVSAEIYGNDSAYVTDYYAGLSAVVSAIEEYFDQIMIMEVKNINIESITEKIRIGLKERIYAGGNRKNYYKKLFNYYVRPSCIDIAAKNSWKTIDTIWHFAGDQSLDSNYYSKRVILFTIYNSAIMNYINSDEAGFQKTNDFIDASLEKTKKFNQFKKKFGPSNLPFVRLFNFN